MILLSAFGANMNSGGEYVTKILKEHYSKIYKLDDFIVIDSKRNYSKINYLAHNKVVSIIIFLFFPLLYPQITRRFKIGVLNKLKEQSHIVLNFTQTFIYALFLKNRKIDLIIHDVLLQVELRKKRYFLLPFIFFWEFIFFRLIENVTLYTLSNKDKQLLIKYYFVKSDKIKVLDLLSLISEDFNFNKTSFFRKKYIDTFEIERRIVNGNTDNLIFGIIGAWKRDENYNGLINLIKGINKNRINLLICGSNIERLNLIDFNNINVELVGFVEDLNTFFNSIDLIIVPLEKGAGVKIKVLQSLIYGVPCIGTTVAFEGIDLNEKCIEFNDIEAIIRFINNE
jgi:hypothetical protein